MTIDIIQYINSNNDIIKWVYEGDSAPITNQSEKHINLQSNNSSERKDFYNSAIIYDIKVPGYTNWYLGVCIFAESPFTLTQYVKWNYSSDWEQGTVRHYSYQSGDYYSTQYYTPISVSSQTYDTTGFNDIFYSDDRTYSFNLTAFNNITDYMDFITQPYISIAVSNGGGATHIAKVTGQLKNLSSSLSDILIVSGGGGGGLLIGETEYPGADAGGISGNGDNSANQTTGYAFGQGESGTNVSGGGSGLYGGYKGVID